MIMDCDNVQSRSPVQNFVYGTSRMQDYSAFIFKLPVEILGKIFLNHAALYPKKRLLPNGTALPTGHAPSVTLLCVCQDWNSIASSIPSLWSVCVVGPAYCRYPYREMVELYLGRTKKLDWPLSLHLSAASRGNGCTGLSGEETLRRTIDQNSLGECIVRGGQQNGDRDHDSIDADVLDLYLLNASRCRSWSIQFSVNLYKQFGHLILDLSKTRGSFPILETLEIDLPDFGDDGVPIFDAAPGVPFWSRNSMKFDLEVFKENFPVLKHLLVVNQDTSRPMDIRNLPIKTLQRIELQERNIFNRAVQIMQVSVSATRIVLRELVETETSIQGAIANNKRHITRLENLTTLKLVGCTMPSDVLRLFELPNLQTLHLDFGQLFIFEEWGKILHLLDSWGCQLKRLSIQHAFHMMNYREVLSVCESLSGVDSTRHVIPCVDIVHRKSRLFDVLLDKNVFWKERVEVKAGKRHREGLSMVCDGAICYTDSIVEYHVGWGGFYHREHGWINDWSRMSWNM